MNVDFSIERALIVEYILDKRNIKTTSSNISAHQNGTLAAGCTGLALGYGCLKAVKVLQSLPLLHLGVKGPLVGHLQESEQTSEAADTSNRVAEDDGRLVLVFPDEVVGIKILFLLLAPNGALCEGVWHPLNTSLNTISCCCQVNDLRGLRTESECLA
jgi:hypothetical protein